LKMEKLQKGKLWETSMGYQGHLPLSRGEGDRQLLRMAHSTFQYTGIYYLFRVPLTQPRR
jgi:hypothetical protein